MRYLTQPVTLKYLTAWILLMHAVVCLFGYLILGASPFINASSLSLILLLDLAVALSLLLASERNAAHFLIVAWFVLINFCVRITVLLFFPITTVDFLTTDLSSAEISNGLLFIVAGVIAILLGIFCASGYDIRNRVKVPTKSKPFSLWALTGYWVIAYLAAYYVRIHLGVSIFGPPENWGNRTAWIAIIFDVDVALVLTICWATAEWRRRGLTRIEIFQLVLLITAWVVLSILSGSRSGPLRVLSWLFFAALAANPLFKLSSIKFASVLVAFFLVNAYVYQVGSVFRAYQGGATERITDIDGFKSISNQKVRELEAGVSELRKSYYQSELLNSFAMRVRPIVTRLAVIDYPLIIFSKPVSQDLLDYYVRSWHPVKNFINNMVPGEIFKESTVNTSRIFTMIYRDRSLQQISEAYMSEPWTLWGMSWLLAGYAGLLIMFGVAFLLQVGYRLLNIDARGMGTYIRCVYFIFPLNIGYQMFGIDHWLTVVLHFSLACFIAYLTMLGLDKLGAGFIKRFTARDPIKK